MKYIIQPADPRSNVYVNGYWLAAEDAVNRARELARQDRQDYQVFKLVETHYIKAPVMPEPEVIDRDLVE